MPKKKVDGVIQAVHYGADGQIVWARTFLRRGPTWSDWVKLDRPTLIANIKSGKRFFIGERVPQMASTFDLKDPVRVVEKNGNQYLVVGNQDSDGDQLKSVPVI